MRIILVAACLSVTLTAQTQTGPARPGNALQEFEKKLESFTPRTAPEPGVGGFSKINPLSRLYRGGNLLRRSANLKTPSRERVTLAPGQPCSIPLRNLLPRKNVDRRMILPPPKDRDLPIHIVAPPAPSCDDVK